MERGGDHMVRLKCQILYGIECFSPDQKAANFCSDVKLIISIATLYIKVTESRNEIVKIKEQSGKRVELTCRKPFQSRIVWDQKNHGGGVIALFGILRRDKWKYDIIVEDTRETLIILAAVVEDSDTYECLIGAETKQFFVEIYVEPWDTKISTPRGTLVEESFLNISCTAQSSRPAANITWTLTTTNGTILELDENGSQTKAHDNKTLTRTSTIKIFASRELYSAKIECRIRVNQVNYDVTRTKYLIFNLKPTLPYITSNGNIVKESSTVTLVCHADDSRPPARLQWFRNGYSLLGKIKMIQNDNSTYNVENEINFIASSFDDGAIYMCRINNEVLQDPIKISKKLAVQYKPITVTKQRVVAVEEGNELLLQYDYKTNPNTPYCKRQTMKYAGLLNSTIELVCRVNSFSNSPTTFNWSSISGDFTGMTYQSDRTHSYHKINYTVEEYGKVSCSASNGIGRMKEDCVFEILPPGPAEAPIDCQITKPINGRVSIECVESFTGGYKTTYSLFTKSSTDWSRTKENNSPYFALNSLKSGQKYLIKICALNIKYKTESDCTEEFEITVPSENIATTTATSKKITTSSTENSKYIIIGAILGGALFIVIVSLIVFICMKKNAKTAAAEENANNYFTPPVQPRAPTDDGPNPRSQRYIPPPTEPQPNEIQEREIV
ncbi:DgyrCDS10180 [Dimorphilus gyrociliatus]|uniref:DgyrCDS10180 n=1 Tax=Dimorphilus gyrociliatus TaxID=2664684 RepID=A0A7I8W0U0_9ANNE|nr:DgyrCDS10180 [Dimorphilus gyrociliatus]